MIIDKYYHIILQQMEKEQLSSIVHRFDEFVELSLQKKNSEHSSPTQTPDNQVEKYKLDMEKRLKLKPASQQDKFDKKFNNMKMLKSFVSVKDFLKDIGNTSQLKKKNKTKFSQEMVSIKEQYQQARGGYYLQKVEEHLHRHNFKRKEDPTFCTQPEVDPFSPSQFGNWMESTLNRIPPKPESMFNRKPDAKDSCKTEEVDSLMEQHKKSYLDQFKKIPNLKEKCNQEYQQFTKISSMLTARLRKLLKTNCASKQSKLQITEVAPPPEKTVRRHLTHRTSLAVPRNQRQKQSKNSTMARVKTAGNLRKDEEEDHWKSAVSQKLRLILQTDNRTEEYR